MKSLVEVVVYDMNFLIYIYVFFALTEFKKSPHIILFSTPKDL